MLALPFNSTAANAAPVYRKGEYFRKELLLDNTNGPLWEPITVSATGQSSVTGNVFLPQTPEPFTYDGDGNLAGDGRWVYTWDGEGRLVGMETPAETVPVERVKPEFWPQRFSAARSG